MMPNPRPRQR